jgi:hypothetical protein
MASQTFNLKQIKDIIKFSVENSVGNIKLPVALWGIHGIGKTCVVEQAAAELDRNLVVLHLATQDVADLIGIPRDIEIKDNNGNVIEKVTQWSCPDWLKNANDMYKATGKPNIFHLDEMNRGNRMVLAAMLPFLINGVLHTHKIGPEDAVICAMNPATDDYEVNELIDKALLDRLAHVIMKPTHAEYIDYLEKTGMDSITLSVVKEDTSWTKIPDFELGFEVKPSRRSIDYVMSVIGKKPKTWIKKKASHVIESYLGPAFRDAWLEKFSSKGDCITIDMLIDYENNAEDINRMLITEIDGETTIRQDLLVKALELIEEYANDKKESLQIKDADWMMKFFSNPLIDDEYAATIFQANSTIKNKILSNYEFSLKVGDFLRNKGVWNEPIKQTWE